MWNDDSNKMIRSRGRFRNTISLNGNLQNPDFQQFKIDNFGTYCR